jgi:pimeloyl-ACP methyl ester carboxylesterase
MTVQYLKRPGKPSLAYVYSPARHWETPMVVFCGGYRSDMNGTKATYLEAQCAARGQGFLRFDYSGHGMSEGCFEDGSISAWYEDAVDILDYMLGSSSAVIVGSSMGGWIALLLALERADNIKGLVGIAAAPDFTEDIYESLTPAQKKELQEKDAVDVPTDYAHEPYRVTKKLYEDGRKNLVLNAIHTVSFPMRLIQGKCDTDVPWKTALKIRECFKSPDLEITFIEDGDHRLSRLQDLEMIDYQTKNI